MELSQQLAIRTLQLEMEYIYRSLEDELLDVQGYGSANGELSRSEAGGERTGA